MSLLAVFVPTTAYSAYQMMMAHLEKGELVKTNKLEDGTELQQVHVKAMVELTRQQVGFQAPHYVNVGGTASYSVPVGGGTVQEEKPVLTIARTPDKTLLHYELIDLDDAEETDGATDTTFKTYYINEMEEFKRTMKTYDVDHNAVPANFPLKVYSIFPNKQMWTSNKWWILGTDKTRVAYKIASQRRLNSASFAISSCVALLSGMFLAFERF